MIVNATYREDSEYALVPEGEGLIAVLAQAAEIFLWWDCEGLFDGALAKARPCPRPSVRGEIGVPVRRRHAIHATILVL